MTGSLDNLLLLGLGTLSIAKKEVETRLRDALKRHNLSDGECDSILKTVMDEGARTRKELTEELERIKKTNGASLVPGFARLEALEKRVEELEKRLAPEPAEQK